MEFPKIFMLSWMILNLLLMPLSFAADKPVEKTISVIDNTHDLGAFGKITKTEAYPVNADAKNTPLNLNYFLLFLPLILFISLTLNPTSRKYTPLLALVVLIPLFAGGVMGACADYELDCGNGICVAPQSEPPDGLGTVDCVIPPLLHRLSVNQNVHYALKSLTIKSGSSLFFTSTEESTTCGSGNFGAGGEKGTRSGNGGIGGDGSDGANRCSFPNSGDSGLGNAAGKGGSVPPYVGAEVSIYAEKIVVNGTLGVDGYRGTANYGGDSGACKQYHAWPFDGDCDYGAAGGGAAGGSGAGVLHLFAQEVNGTGTIRANGGNGGEGGTCTDEDAETCGTKPDDHGAAGGGGGGGSGGKIQINGAYSSDLNITCYGGTGGYQGCGQPTTYARGEGSYWGTKGKDASPQGSAGEGSNCLMVPSADGEGANIKFCTDKKDNDFDGLTDMEDPDCFNSEHDQVSPGACPSTNYGPIPGYIDDSSSSSFPSWFNKSATDGFDGCCGDDAPRCVLNYSSCNEVPTGSCDIYSDCHVDYDCHTQKSGVTLPDCSAFGFQDGCDDVGFALGCSNSVGHDCDYCIGVSCDDTCYDCIGTSSCSNVPLDSCGSVRDYCVETDSSGVCAGGKITDVCAGLSKDDCESEPACTMTSSSPFTSDYGSIVPNFSSNGQCSTKDGGTPLPFDCQSSTLSTSTTGGTTCTPLGLALGCTAVMPTNTFEPPSCVGVPSCSGVSKTNCTGIAKDYCEWKEVPSGQDFLCYRTDYYDINTNSIKGNWTWFDADSTGGVTGKIFNLKEGSKSLDAVSNAQQWFVCNATNHGLTNGILISNLGNPTSPVFSGNVKGPCIYSEGLDYSILGSPECHKDNDATSSDLVCDADCGEKMAEKGYGGCCAKSTWDYEPKECATCYGASGKISWPDPGSDGTNQPSGDNTELEKISDIPNSGLPSDASKSCRELTGQPNCNPGQTICSGGEWVLAKDVNYTDLKTQSQTWVGCCYGGICKTSDQASDPSKDCATLKGFVCPSDNICTLQEITDNDPDTICCGSALGCQPDVSTATLVGPNFGDNFLCHNQFGSSTLTECCYGTFCVNRESYPSDALGNPTRLAVTGSGLTSIESSDEFDSNADNEKVLSNKVTKYTRSSSGRITIPFWGGAGSNRKMFNHSYSNWTGYNFLEFDLRFDQTGAVPASVDKLFLVNSSGSTKYVSYMHNLSTSDLKEGLFHRFRVNLSEVQDKENINTIEISYVGPLIIRVDNVRLLKQNYLNPKLCAGEFASWIDGYNPSGPVDPNDLMSYGPWQVVCDAQLPFDWTGTKCCGAMNEVGPTGAREYYNDTQSACWQGVIVPNNMRVSDSRLFHGEEQPKFKNVLFYNKTFHACLVDVNVSESNSDIGREVLPNWFNIPEETVCSTQGDWYCHPQGFWANDEAGNVPPANRSEEKTYSGNLLNLGGFDGSESEVKNFWKGAAKFDGALANLSSNSDSYAYLTQTISVSNNVACSAYGCSVSFIYQTSSDNLEFYTENAEKTTRSDIQRLPASSPSWTQFNFTTYNDSNKVVFRIKGDNQHALINTVSFQKLPSPVTSVTYGYNDGCCSPETCWNGTSCVFGFDNTTLSFGDALHVSEGKISGDASHPESFVGSYVDKPPQSFVCSRVKSSDNTFANWERVYSKRSQPTSIGDPTGDRLGYCLNNSQCWLKDDGFDLCVDSGFSKDGFYCEDGEWYSNIRYVLLAMLDYVNTSSNNIDNYSVYCEPGKKALTEVAIYDISGNPSASCVMQADDKIFFGATFSDEIKMTDFVRRDLDEGSCTDPTKDITDVNTFQESDSSCGGKKLWVDKKIFGIIYSNDSFNLNPSQWDIWMSFFTNPIDTIKSWLGNFLKPEETVTQSTYEAIDELDVLGSVYTAESVEKIGENKKSWFGSKQNLNGKDETFDVKYLLTTNMCESIQKKYGTGSDKSIRCDHSSEAPYQYVTSTFGKDDDNEWKNLGPSFRWT